MVPDDEMDDNDNKVSDSFIPVPGATLRNRDLHGHREPQDAFSKEEMDDFCGRSRLSGKSLTRQVKRSIAEKRSALRERHAEMLASNDHYAAASDGASRAVMQTKKTARRLVEEGIGGARAVGAIAERKRESRLEKSNVGDDGGYRPYDNVRCDDDYDFKNGDEVAWQIISVVLKGWCIIWVLFAILVVSAELLSPHRSSKKNAQKKNIAATEEGAQHLLEISEDVISACSYSNLDSEGGREDCQALCHNHMCCFVDEEDEDDSLESYSCIGDPQKVCPAYAGCESLIVSEDDAVIYDADGIDVFGSESDAGGDETTSGGGAEASGTSELQLIRQVVSSVCSPSNLHSRHGLLECSHLCSPSMCCFDRNEIESINPKMDLILKMEGISNDVLDRRTMGSCVGEEAGDEDMNEGDKGLQKSHFCQVHEGCKNILLLGAPLLSSANATLNGNPTQISTNVGAYDKSTHISGNGNASPEKQRMLVAVFVFFGLIIGFTTYLLYKSNSPVVTASMARIEMVLKNNARTDRTNCDSTHSAPEIVDFV